MPAKLPSLSRAVAMSIKDAQIEPWGRGAANLAQRYAHLIDVAQALAEEMEGLRADDESTAAALARLQARVDAQQVACDLGPKLLQALSQLGLTPMARSGPGKGTTETGSSRGPADALARLRAEHARSH